MASVRGTIPEVGALRQQELLGAPGPMEYERLSGRGCQDSLLKHLETNIDDPAQFCVLRSLKTTGQPDGEMPAKWA